MGIHDAKTLVGKTCSVHWLDRAGNEVSTVTTIYDVTFAPLYGGYLVGDDGEIRLDRVTRVAVLDEGATFPQLAAA